MSTAFSLTEAAENDEYDCKVDHVRYPETGGIVLTSSAILEAAGSEAVTMLHTRPVSFAAVALVEVLARWQWRGVPCSECRIPAEPDEEAAKRLTKRYTDWSVGPLKQSVRGGVSPV